MAGFLGDLGAAVGGHYADKLRSKYLGQKKRKNGQGTQSSDNSSPAGEGGLFDIGQRTMQRRKARAKSRG